MTGRGIAVTAASEGALVRAPTALPSTKRNSNIIIRRRDETDRAHWVMATGADVDVNSAFIAAISAGPSSALKKKLALEAQLSSEG